ncbi:MAG: hypothetical protein R3F59_01015 [Myxococcota bacterium]
MGELPTAWRWASGADRADPGARSEVWTRDELEATRAVLRSGGADLPPQALIAAMADHVVRLARTPPGQGEPETLFAALLRAAAQQEAPTVARAVATLRTWQMPEVPDWSRVSAAPRGLGRVGDAVIVRELDAFGWRVPPTPPGWYGAVGAPLRAGPVPEAPPAWVAAVGRDLQAALGRLPAAPAVWRRDALLLLLERITPVALCAGIAPDAAGLGLLEEAVAGTRLAGPLLATAGEWLLVDGRAAPDAPEDTPAGRCVAALRSARGLPDAEAVALFVAARDAATGAVAPDREAFRQGAVEPLSAAALAEDAPAFAAAIRRLDGLGGAEAATDALARILADGATTPAGLRRIGAALAPDDAEQVRTVVADSIYAGWLGIRAG